MTSFCKTRFIWIHSILQNFKIEINSVYREQVNNFWTKIISNKQTMNPLLLFTSNEEQAKSKFLT